MLSRIGRMALLFAATPYMIAAELRALANGPRDLAAVRSLLDHTIGERDELRAELRKARGALDTAKGVYERTSADRDAACLDAGRLQTRLSVTRGELDAAEGMLAQRDRIRRELIEMGRAMRHEKARADAAQRAAVELQAEVDKARAERDEHAGNLATMTVRAESVEALYRDLARRHGTMLDARADVEPVDAEPCAQSTFAPT